MESQGKLNLHYWNIRGLAQPIVYLLEHTKIAYNFIPYDGGDKSVWLKEKENLRKQGFKFPNLPFVEDGDLKLSESMAIMFHIAQKSDKNLIPATESLDVYLMYSGVISDLYGGITGIGYGSKDQADFELRMKRFFERSLPKIESLEEHLSSNTWVMGDDLTVIDFLLGEFYEKLIAMEKDAGIEILAKMENFRRYFTGFCELAGVKEHRESDQFGKPYNNVSAFWGSK